jgi:hypothetical protein
MQVIYLFMIYLLCFYGSSFSSFNLPSHIVGSFTGAGWTVGEHFFRDGNERGFAEIAVGWPTGGKEGETVG